MSKVYEFAISRKLSIVLALCCMSAGVLLFVAGAMTGVLLAPQDLAQRQTKPGSSAAKLEASAKIPAAPKAESVQPPPASQEATAQPSASATAPAQTAPVGAANPISPQAVSSAAATAAPGATTVAGSPAPAAASSTGPVGSASAATPGAPGNNASSAANAQETAVSPKPMLASAPEIYPVSLAVQVGSFLVADNANRLARSLQQLGYPAEIVSRLDSRQRTWYVVRLGPYHRWDAASNVALRLASNSTSLGLASDEDLKPIVGPM